MNEKQQTLADIGVIGGVLIALLIAVGSWMFYDLLLQLFGTLLFTIQILCGMTVVTGGVWLTWFGGDRLIMLLLRLEELRQSRATTSQMRAHVMVIQSQATMNHATALSEGTIIKEVTANKALFMLQSNGETRYIPALATTADAATAESVPRTFDLIEVFTQTLQVYGIVAGQQVGKTFQARHIMSAWQRLGADTWMIGPKWDKGEWVNCRMFGGNNNYKAVDAGLTALRDEASRRHSHPTLGNKEHKPLLVVCDDWTPVVEQCPEAATFILEATTLFASVNIVLLFLIHSDTAPAWGVAKKGAALKDNFLKLYIIPTYDKKGKVIRDLTRAEVKFPGDDNYYPIPLISDPVQWPTLDNGGQSDGQAAAATVDKEDKAPWHNEKLEDYDRIYLYLSAAKADGADITGAGFGWPKVKLATKITGGNDAVLKMVSEAKAEILQVKQS